MAAYACPFMLKSSLNCPAPVRRRTSSLRGNGRPIVPTSTPGPLDSFTASAFTALSRADSHRRLDFRADYDKIMLACQRPLIRRNRNRSGVLTRGEGLTDASNTFRGDMSNELVSHCSGFRRACHRERRAITMGMLSGTMTCCAPSSWRAYTRTLPLQPTPAAR